MKERVNTYTSYDSYSLPSKIHTTLFITPFLNLQLLDINREPQVRSDMGIYHSNVGGNYNQCGVPNRSSFHSVQSTQGPHRETQEQIRSFHCRINTIIQVKGQQCP